MNKSLLLLALLGACFFQKAVAQDSDSAPMYVDAKAIEDRFSTITDADMEMLRSKHILLGGQSLTPILDSGLKLLAQKDKKYEFLSPNFMAVKYDDTTESKLPPEVFTYSKGNYVHFYIDVHNYKLRYDEMDTLIRGKKYGFGNTVDVALIVEHTNCGREDFEYYAKKFDQLQADFPRIRFIYTTGISVPNRVKMDWMSEDANGFGEEVRARYMGKAPLWDLQKMLNNNFQFGYGTCPDYSGSITDDPNAINLHPYVPTGQLVVAKGFLLALRDALRAPWPPKQPLGPVVPDGRTLASKTIEPIPADSPDAKAVRAILDANGLKDKKLEDVAQMEGGRITKLFIMGMGIENLTSSIGELTELRELLVYGYHAPWKFPLLKTVDPAIGKCTKLEVLALNRNDLTTLPDSIASLPKLKILSIGDNHLQNLSPAITDLVKRLDPSGLVDQSPSSTSPASSSLPPVPLPAPQVPSPVPPTPSSQPTTSMPEATPPTAPSSAKSNSAPLVPEKDPVATGEPVKLRTGLEGQHPRLFLTAAQLPQLRAYYNSDAAAVFRKQFLADLAGCTPPKCIPPSTRGWVDGIDGIGRPTLPTVALHYLLTGDKTSLARAKEYLQCLAGTANWSQGGEPFVENTPEAYAKVLATMKKMPPHADIFSASEPFAVNSDPHAAYMLAGAAIAWDWLYNDLDPGFREQFRQILWQHARALYYGGFTDGNLGRRYWLAFLSYNHRSSMNLGLAMATVATTEGKPEEQWLLQNQQKELQFLEKCLAPDGSRRLGPLFGDQLYAEAGMAFQMSDDCLGTHYLDSPFFRNTSTYLMQDTAPGLREAFYFGDSNDKATAIEQPFNLKIASHLKQADQMDGLRQSFEKNPQLGESTVFAWLSLLSDDPNLQGGDYSKLPTTGFYPDMGISLIRDSWQENAVAAMFKCGPPGGYQYSSFWHSASVKEKGPLQQNYGHDNPDANTFSIFGDGEYLAETNRGGGKLSASYNSILINKIGQTQPWQHEGEEWVKWAKDDKDDVTKMGVITAYKDAGDVVVSEGEAAGSYGVYDDAKTQKSRPALERFRRDFIWVKGGYILVLDDIRAPQPVEVTWLMQGAKLEPVAQAQNKYRLSKNKAQCDFQLLSDTNFKSVIGVSTANLVFYANKPTNWQQLQATANAKAVRFVSIYDPWHHQDLKLTFTPSGPDKATITVNGSGIADTWQWESAKGPFDAATIHGTRPKGFDVLVDATTAIPPPHD